MSEAEMKAKLAKLEAENAALKQQATASVRVRFSEKGAIMVTGLGRFPTTLYAEQWAKVFGVADQIKALCAQAKPRATTTAQAIG